MLKTIRLLAMIRNMGASDKYHEDFVKRSFHRLSRGAAQFSLLHNTARLSPVRSLALSISSVTQSGAVSTIARRVASLNAVCVYVAYPYQNGVPIYGERGDSSFQRP